MSTESLNVTAASARAHRESAYRKAAANVAEAEAALARNPGDRAADVAVDVAYFSLTMAENALAAAGEPLPKATAATPIRKAAARSSSSAGGLVAGPVPESTRTAAGSIPKHPAPDPAAEIEAAAQRILASDGPAEVPPSDNPAVDAVAARIAASDCDDCADSADAVAKRIAAA